MEARRAHNPEVVGSSPASATKKEHHPFGWCSFLVVAACFAAATLVMSPTSVARWVSERSAAGGGRSDSSAVQRSVCNAGALSPRHTPGTANRAAEPMPNYFRSGARRVLPTRPTLRTEKDIGSETPEIWAVSGLFHAIFQSKIKKISFPQNDLWGGLELKKRLCKCYLTKSSDIFFIFARLSVIIKSDKRRRLI